MFVGVDVGTGSLKAVMGFESGLQTITEKYLPSMFVQNDHIVKLFKQSVQLIFTRIAGLCDENNESIDGIGLCGHGPSLLLMNRNGDTLTDIITWQNNSAVLESDKLEIILDNYSKDGSSYEAKVFKLYSEKRGLFNDGVKVLYPKDYVIYLLTGRIVIDYSTASTIAFFDTETRSFSTSSTGIPPGIFPEVVNSWEKAGSTVSSFSQKAGLKNGIPVIAGGIDAWCESLGAGAVEAGMLVDGSGTSTCITCCRLDEESSLTHVIPERSLDIETMSATGTSIAWLMTLLQIDLSEIAGMKPSSPVPIIYLPYLDGERSPVWDERALASFTGLSKTSSRNDIVRSVLQGISFGTRQCLELSGKGTANYGEGVRAVGGGSNNKALLQLKSDITGLKYCPMKEPDAAPLGAMILAAYGCGNGTISELVNRWVHIASEIIPNETYKDVWNQLFDVYSNQFKTLKETSHILYDIGYKLKKHEKRSIT